MGGSISQIAVYVLGASVFGVVVGWLIRGAISKPRIAQLVGEGQTRLNEVTAQRDQFAVGYSKSRSTIESLQAAIAKGRTELESALEKSKLLARNVLTLRAEGRTELESALEKSKLLARNVLTLRAEREDTKIKVSTIQNALISLKQQTVALQTEFDKAAEFYKGELAKSFEKRKTLQEKVEHARLKQETFDNLLESSISEHGSADNMIAAAQMRLGQLDVLARNVNKLEAENEQLIDDARRMKHDNEALEREVAELNELKIHNQQLVRCLGSLESSRKQHEHDAGRYRDQADQSEQLSDTLRLKLDDVEKNFADIEKQQHRALKIARKAAVVPTLSAKKSHPKEVGDVQEIVGVGKVLG